MSWIMWRVILIVLMLPVAGMAETLKEVQTPDEVGQDLNYLLSFVGPNRADPKSFNPGKIAAVLKFVLSSKEKKVLHFPEAVDGVASAYFEIDVGRSLDQILRLTDNPDVPAVFTAPSTVRSALWTRIDTPGHQRPMLWEQVPDLQSSVSFTGVEHLVNTPDQTTGAYYEYDLDRTVILAKADGRNLLISLSRQAGVSSAGKKGWVIGRDDQWDYLYTGQSGLNRFGLGWVDSYMYDSYSVAFYLEGTAGKPSVRFGVFKWLRAGWSDINFVKRSHIHGGLQRFAEVFKRIVEHRRIGDDPGLTDTLLGIQRLKTDQLQKIVQEYLAALQQQIEKDDSRPDADVKSLLKDGSYMDSLGPEEMRSIVVLEYLKQLLGKPTRVDLKQRLANLLY